MLFPPFLFALLLGGEPASADDDPRAPIELYFQAHATGNGDFIRQSFTPDARISFVSGDQLTQWTREEFANRFHGPAPDESQRVRRIERLDATGNAASAVLTLDYPDVVFTDHLSLLKIEGQWKIVNKIFWANRRNRAQAVIDETLQNWSLPFPPRKIVGNVYYVGSNLISSFLIATPDGHILIDTGTAQMLPQVEANIEKLGFHVEDVKFLLNSHAHFDHGGGFAEFKSRTGAAIVASKLDGALMGRGGKGDFFWGDGLAYEPAKPDRSVNDGDHITFGGVTLTAHLTPGHTQGCTTWTMRVREHGRNYDVMFLCGLTVSLYKLTNNQNYRNIVSDARNSIAKLRGMHADVLLASHGFWFDLESKAFRQDHQAQGAPNPFIDPTELPRHLDEMTKDLDQAMQSQERPR
jgi:metallo-beta-lactamase class B